MEANYFTILYWYNTIVQFRHTSKWISHRCTRGPHPEPPSHVPPHTILLGHPSAPAPSILHPASNLDWRFISLCKTAKETQMYRTVFWTLWERERVGWFRRMALKHVNYHMWNELPVQVRCMIQDAQGWCNGMTKREGMGREVGKGFRIGNMCTAVVDSCWCMAKPTQYCKVISLQLK